MKSFFDTSSLVKRYIQESGSDKVDEIFISSESIVVSSITQIEFTSALTRRFVDQSVEEKSYREALSAFRSELEYFEIIPFNAQIEKYAVGIIEKRAMKTLDAIQLSSAIESAPNLFVTSDKRLFDVASKATGLKSLFI